MTLVEGETRRKRVWTSSPLISGIRMSIIARSGQSVAACSKNVLGSVKALTCQPTESRSRLVALRTERSSSSRNTDTGSLLSVTILNVSGYMQIASRYRNGSDFGGQNGSLLRRNVRHTTTLASQATRLQSDLSPGSDR